jgi:hypothetical protein
MEAGAVSLHNLPYDVVFPDPPVPTFDGAGLMVPPFVKCARIPRASIGWRMGEGEEYWDEFRAWWGRQPAGVRAEVRDAYPEPLGWVRFYDEL